VTKLSNGHPPKKFAFESVVNRDSKSIAAWTIHLKGLISTAVRDLCAFIDFLAVTYVFKLILVDHLHHLPNVNHRKLILNAFTIEREEAFVPEATNLTKPTTDSTRRTDSAMPVIEIRDLKIQYRDHIVLQNFNWTCTR
jgi:hypothetical protein